LKPLDARAAAAQTIGEVLVGRSLNQALPSRLALASARDRGLVQQLCYGTLRQAPRLQALLEQMLAKPLRDKDSDVQGLMLCGLYQLESTRIPDHAAVASTVGAVAALKKPWAKGMVNAVLRRFLREREALAEGLSAAATASHPQWLYESLLKQWPGAATDILAANNLQPPMTLRINSSLGSREMYLARLAEQGIEALPGLLSPHAIYLAEPRDVFELPGFVDQLRGRNEDEVADRAERELPEVVDTEEDAHLLHRLGINPADLLGGIGGTFG
jgi:16S rRNA (cytosine967-C5)-methyltransferase